MRKTNGYVLVLTMIVMFLLLMMALFYVKFSMPEQHFAMKGEMELIAMSAADAGLEDAFYNIKQYSGWTGGFTNVSLPHSKATYSVTFNKNQTILPYSTNNIGGTTAVTGYGGRIIPAGMAHIISIGKFGSVSHIEEAMIGGTGNLFSSGIFVDNSINITGNSMTDSFDSSKGTYDQTKELSGGDIATNSVDEGAVRLSGNVVINGGVSSGPTGIEDVVIKKTGGATYQSFSANPNRNLSIVPAPSGTSNGAVNLSGQQIITLAPGIYDSLNVSGQATVNLQAGQYVFKDGIKTSGGGQVILPAAGKVELFTDGDIDITGNSLYNTSQIPTNLIIYGGEHTKNVKITGNGLIYAGIYAPKASFNITGNGTIFGALVGNDMKITGNGALHYDKALGSINGGGGTGRTILSRW